jgi:hypothetical protein
MIRAQAGADGGEVEAAVCRAHEHTKLREREQDTPQRFGLAVRRDREFLDPARTVGQQVGNAELGGDLDQECRPVAADEPT